MTRRTDGRCPACDGERDREISPNGRKRPYCGECRRRKYREGQEVDAPPNLVAKVKQAFRDLFDDN